MSGLTSIYTKLRWYLIQLPPAFLRMVQEDEEEEVEELVRKWVDTDELQVPTFYKHILRVRTVQILELIYKRHDHKLYNLN